MYKRKIRQLYAALQVTINVNIYYWERHGYNFSACNVPPSQLLFLQSHRRFIYFCAFLLQSLSSFFWWLLVPIYFLQILLSVFKLIQTKICSKKEIIFHETLFFNASKRAFPSYKYCKRQEDFTIFTLDTKKFPIDPEFEKRPNILIWDLVTFTNIFDTLLPMCQVLYLMHRNRKNVLITLQSHSFLLGLAALSRYPNLKRIIFTNIDRWSYLCTYSKEIETVFIQHGIVSAQTDIPLYRDFPWSQISLAYCYGEAQLKILEKIIKRILKVEYITPQIKLTSIEHKQDVKTILLICCVALFQKKEEEIIRSYAEKKNVLMYVKPHPVFSITFYQNLKERYNFELIEEKDFFPDVDEVISYESTLAYEYMLCGKKVSFHSSL